MPSFFIHNNYLLSIFLFYDCLNDGWFIIFRVTNKLIFNLFCIFIRHSFPLYSNFVRYYQVYQSIDSILPIISADL